MKVMKFLRQKMFALKNRRETEMSVSDGSKGRTNHPEEKW